MIQQGLLPSGVVYGKLTMPPVWSLGTAKTGRIKKIVRTAVALVFNPCRSAPVAQQGTGWKPVLQKDISRRIYVSSHRLVDPDDFTTCVFQFTRHTLRNHARNIRRIERLFLRKLFGCQQL